MSDRPDGNGVPWGSIAVVAAFVSSTLLVQHPFQPLRPDEKEHALPQQGAELEVEARLWEDPFAAARRYESDRRTRCDKLGNSRKLQTPAASAPGGAVTGVSTTDASADCGEPAGQARRQPARLLHDLDRNGNQDLTETLVVAVMLPGNAFVGAEESRRRTRYALLAGLQAQYLSPDDPEHFGLLQFDLPAGKGGSHSLRVPYEMLSQQPILRGSAGAGHQDESYAQVAVLWIDETALPQPMLNALAGLVGQLMATPTTAGWRQQVKPRSIDGREQGMRANLPALALIGPSSSDGLRQALRDLDRAANSCDPAPLNEAAGKAVDAASRPRCRDDLPAPVIEGYRQLAKARLFNATATAGASAMPELHEQNLDAYIKERLARIAGMPVNREVEYLRTMATDDKVLRSLVVELQLRLPADVKRRVVLLAERDSLYAQALVSELRWRLSDNRSPQYNPNLRLETRFFYRGLDGATTFDGAAERPATGKDKDSAALLEWPESRDQLDYLRRVAISLKHSESERPIGLPHRQSEADQTTEGGPIGAIGLLASDVHDKLLVLQALHESFPDKVFFTTDLDARYMHPRTLGYTRNLVLASSLPLAFAKPRLQAGAPPFRDVYQTSVFLAAQRAGCRQGQACEALHDDIQEAIAQPSVYEIGRQQAVPLAGYDHSQRVRDQHLAHTGIVLPMWLVLAGALWFWPSTPALRQVRDWVFGKPAPPASKAQAPPLSNVLLAVLHLGVLAFALGSTVEFAAPGRLGLTGILLLTASVTGVVLLMLLGRGAMRPLALDNATAMPTWLAPAAGALLMLAAAVWIAWPTESAAPCTACEPAAWLEGVSAWPSHLVHLLALVALVCILDVQWSRIRDRFDIDTRWLALAPVGMPSASLLRRAWWREHSIVGWSPPPTDPKNANELGHASVGFDLLWRETAHRAEPMARMVRALVWYVVTLGLMVALFFALSDGQIPEVPVRGPDHRNLVRLTLYAVLALLPMLMVAVADATVLNQRLIKHLDKGRTDYPEATVQRFANALGGPAQAALWQRRIAAPPWQRGDSQLPGRHTLLDNWIDVRLIGRRTAAVAPLIVGPLLIVALLVVARSRLFDNWAITMPVALGICAYLAWLVVLAVLLKRSAEKAREHALRRMQADLLWLGGAGSDWQSLVEPFKRLIEEVRGNQEGAFAPLFEQALFKGLMVPLGGIGSTQLFDYLLLAR